MRTGQKKNTASKKRCLFHVPVCRYGMMQLDSLIFHHHFIRLALIIVSSYDLFFSGLYPKLSGTPPNNLFPLHSVPLQTAECFKSPIEFIFSCLKRREYWISSVIWNIAYLLPRIIEQLLLLHIFFFFFLRYSFSTLLTCPLLFLCGPDFTTAPRWPVRVIAGAGMKILNQTRRTLGIIT